MDTVLLITVLVLVAGGNPALGLAPCQRTAPDNNAYKKFVSKHVLPENFATNSMTAWENYLRERRLCDRPRQSFVKNEDGGRYVQICNGHGKRQSGNLCTSTRPIFLYDLRVQRRGCRVTKMRKQNRYVTVACDKVDNRCRPVHFDGSQGRRPRTGETCGARPSL